MVSKFLVFFQREADAALAAAGRAALAAAGANQPPGVMPPPGPPNPVPGIPVVLVHPVPGQQQWPTRCTIM